jgi:hypothetical protein
MSEPINLNKVRKARAKVQAKAKAAENRIVHGLPKAVRDLAAAREAKAKSDLASRKRED